MFCPKCGNQAADGDLFCGMCGADLRAVAGAVAPPQPPSQPQPTAPMPAAAPAPPQPTAPMPATAVPTAAAPAGAFYPKAGLGARFLAYSIDGLIASALLPVGALVVAAAAARGDTSLLGWALYGLGIVWMLAYVLVRDAFGGAGPGKRLAGLVVTSALSGAPQGGGPAVMRQLILLLTGLVPLVGPLIEPVIVLTDKDGRRLGDKVAKTQVARVADVTARGLAAQPSKAPAAIALSAALVVMLAGSGIGGFLAWRSVQQAATGTPVVTTDESATPQGEPGEKPAEPTGSPLSPSKDPARTVEAYYAALAAGDFDALRTLFVPEMADAASPDLFKDWSNPSFSVEDVATEGANAFVQVRESGGGSADGPVTFTLVEDGGFFLITALSLGTIDDAKAALADAAGGGWSDGPPGGGMSQVEKEEAVFTKANAIDAVGRMLNALRTDDMKTAKAYATARFKKEDPGFFRPSSEAFLKFEVTGAVRDGGTWVVTVREEWISGPETVRYIVVLEDMKCRVDQQLFD